MQGDLLEGGNRRCRITAELALQSRKRVEAAQRRRLESQQRLAAAQRMREQLAEARCVFAPAANSMHDNVITMPLAARTQAPLVRRLLWELGDVGTAELARTLFEVFDEDDDGAILTGLGDLRRWLAARRE